MKNKPIKYLDINDIHKIETKLIEVCDKICRENNINYTLVCGSALGAVRHKGPIPWDTDADITIAYGDRERFIGVMEKNMPSWCILDKPDVKSNNHSSFPKFYVKGIDPIIVHVDIFTYVGLPDSRDEQIKYSRKSDFLNKIFFYKKCKVLTEYYQSRNVFFSVANKLKRFFMKIALLPVSHKMLLSSVNKHYLKYDSKESKYVMNPAGHYGMENVLDRRFYDETIRTEYDSIIVNIPKDYDEYLKHYYKEWRKIPPSTICDKGLNTKVPVFEGVDLSFAY